MATKVTIETPVGVFTRRTERPYTHAVVAVGKSEAYLEQKHGEHVAYLTRERAKYQAIANGERAGIGGFSREEYQKWANGVTETLEHYAAQHQAALDANSEAKRTDKGSCLSWHMSLNQADKAATKARNEGWQRVQVVPVGRGA